MTDIFDEHLPANVAARYRDAARLALERAGFTWDQATLSAEPYYDRNAVDYKVLGVEVRAIATDERGTYEWADRYAE